MGHDGFIGFRIVLVEDLCATERGCSNGNVVPPIADNVIQERSEVVNGRDNFMQERDSLCLEIERGLQKTLQSGTNQ